MSNLRYINVQSNHPPNVIKHIPISIANRISTLSCNNEEYRKVIPAYSAALEESGHKPTMTPPLPTHAGRSKRNRSRNILWFNPPFNQNVTTDVCKQFLHIVRKHFPIGHRYHKLFNKNNVKCSYSCMRNMASIISTHNAKILTPTTAPLANSKLCNCRTPSNCPLNGLCLTESIVYKATVSAATKPKMVYYGLTENRFKERYNDHTSSFRNRTYISKTKLSSYIWELKDQGIEPHIQWEIHKHAAPYICGTKRCDLCLTEKLVIATAEPTSLLNKRSELVSCCRHVAKFRCDKVPKL